MEERLRNPNFESFEGKSLSKKHIENIFSSLQALTKCKVSKKVLNSFREKASLTYARTYRQTRLLSLKRPLIERKKQL